MKRDWLLYLVIFSLALNIGAIGTFGYLYYQGRREPPMQQAEAKPFRPLWGRLNLDEQQRAALKDLMPEHRRRVMELRRDLAQKRQELLALIKVENPAWPDISAKIREISSLQGSLEEEVVRFLLAIEGRLRPEQKAEFLKLVEQRVERMGHPFGPHGRGRGMGPGHGRGFGPPGPPAGPPPGPPPE